MTPQTLAGGQPVNQSRGEGAAETAHAPVMPAPLAQAPAIASTPLPEAPAEVPASPAPARLLTGEPRMKGLRVELVVPAQSQAGTPVTIPIATQPVSQPVPQPVPQPVLAQLLQSQARSGDGRADNQGRTEEQALRVAVVSAASDAAGVEEAETLRPVVAPQAGAALPAAPQSASVPQPVIPLADMATAAPNAAAAATTTGTAEAGAAPRHDFEAVVGKLAEARELARPGRAEMHVPHREFGQVSVRFDLAGDALKVAMSSPDAAFAPAVQAALAERPVTPLADAIRADSGRADAAPARSDAPVSASSAQVGPQADGQRSDAQQRNAAATRNSTEQVQRQREGDEQGSRQPSAGRDGGLFA